MSRILFAALLAACASPKGRPQLPTVRLPAPEAAVTVRDVWISTPERVPEAEIPSDHAGLAPTRARIELTVVAAFDCDPSAFVIEEREGSIFSFGIGTAVTYYRPVLKTDSCRGPAPPRDYVLSVAWMRRSDVPWTIVVAPYAGDDRLPDSAMFARALAGHTASRPPQSGATPIETSGESLTNAPSIQKVRTRRDGDDLAITLDLEYGNPCLLEDMPWVLEPIATRIGDTTHVWANLERGPITQGCGEVYQPTPVTVTYRIRAAGRATLAIANVKTDTALPIFRKTL